MTTRFGYFLSILLLLYAIACKKEYSFEKAKRSQGEIFKNNLGDCDPIKSSGIFIVGKSMNDSNDLELNIQVNSSGLYLIQTDTINGYYFKAAGNFQDTGRILIKLKAFGIPKLKGTDNFTIRYDSSLCVASINVKDTIIEPSLYSFPGAPDACLNAIVKGLFVEGRDLDTSSGVIIKVLVDQAGTYNITTNTINGYSFSSTGIFTKTGEQDLLLTAIGSPVSAQTDNFIINGAATNCSISIPVKKPVPVSINDYFPLSMNSFWVYDDASYPNDSLKRALYGSSNQNGFDYATMSEKMSGQNLRSLDFRKSGINYFEYCRADKYTGSIVFADNLMGELPFVRDILSVDETWESPEFKGAASFGQVITVKYQYTCVEKNAAVEINGKVFTDVYKVKMYPFIKSEFAGYGSTSEVYDFYYARGVGLIYMRKFSTGYVVSENWLRRWMVY